MKKSIILAAIILSGCATGVEGGALVGKTYTDCRCR